MNDGIDGHGVQGLASCLRETIVGVVCCEEHVDAAIEVAGTEQGALVLQDGGPLCEDGG